MNRKTKIDEKSVHTKEKKKRVYPTSRQIFLIAAGGAFIAGSLILPGLPRILMGNKFDITDFLAEDEWEQFDERRLRRRLKEMQKRKLVKVYKANDRYVVKVTKKGRRKALSYKFEDLAIPKPKVWDKKWRIVVYDVPRSNNKARNAIREILKKLNFYQLQESVYIHPYDCEDIIDFLKEFYEIGENVSLLTVTSLEEDKAFKDYFGL